MKCGAQLYTVRDFCRTPEGFAETLKKIADIGYTEVQVSGTCAYQPEWLKEQLESTGLSCVITHYDINMIKNDPARAVRENAVFGCRHIGIGSMPGGASGLIRRSFPVSCARRRIRWLSTFFPLPTCRSNLSPDG